MATDKLDINDAALSPIFVFTSAISLGLINPQWFGIDFSNEIATFTASSGQTTVVTLATILSLAVVGYAYFTNRNDFSQFSKLEGWIVIATVALVVAPPFMPVVSEFLSGDLPGFIALMVQAGGYYTLSYLG